MSFNAPVEGRSATEAEASTASRDVDVDVVEEKSDGAGAVAALDLVPTTSRGYTESRRLRADVQLAGRAPATNEN